MYAAYTFYGGNRPTFVCFENSEAEELLAAASYFLIFSFRFRVGRTPNVVYNFSNVFQPWSSVTFVSSHVILGIKYLISLHAITDGRTAQLFTLSNTITGRFLYPCLVKVWSQFFPPAKCTAVSVDSPRDRFCHLSTSLKRKDILFQSWSRETRRTV